MDEEIPGHKKMIEWKNKCSFSFFPVSADTMLLPASLLIGLLCLSHAGGAWGFARLLEDVELRSAFSVARTNSMEGGPKMTVTFDTVYVNIGGDFDPKAGMLRCRIPGAYYFSFTVGKFPHKDLSVMLMKNRNEVQAIVYEENAGEERKVGFTPPNQRSPLVSVSNCLFYEWLFPEHLWEGSQLSDRWWWYSLINKSLKLRCSTGRQSLFSSRKLTLGKLHLKNGKHKERLLSIEDSDKEKQHLLLLF